MNILVAILIFTLIIVIHEFGHFLLAKKNEITVTEFSVGMGPRIITAAKGTNGFVCRLFLSESKFAALEGCENVTKYSWKLLPIGGSCAMVGEDELSEDVNAFNKKSIGARMAVVFAGPLFNFILAFLLALLFVGVSGHDVAEVRSLEEGYPLAEAGMQEGDIITSFDGKRIDLARELGVYLQFHPLDGDTVEISYLRDGEAKKASVTPLETEEGTYKLGFGYGALKKSGPAGVVKYALLEIKYQVSTTIESLKMLLTGKVSVKNLMGPVGIVEQIGGSIEAGKEYGTSAVFSNILSMCILLSANLGVMNLLPLPALDGGRLVFLIIEIIRKKPIDQEKEGMINFVGLMALMALMVFVLYNDIARIF